MLFILLLFLPGRVVAQPYSSDTLSLKVYFPINESSVDYTFGGNGARIREFVRGWNAIKDQSRVQEVVVIGSASPEGPKAFNRRIAEERARHLGRHIAHLTGLQESQFLYDIQDNTGAPIADDQWEQYRHAGVLTVVLATREEETPQVQQSQNPQQPGQFQDKVIQENPEPSPESEPEKKSKPSHGPFIFGVKTNLLLDLAMIPAIGIEFPFGNRWSAALSWHYAWWHNDAKAWYWQTYGGDIAVRKYFGKDKGPLTGHHLGIYGQVLSYDFEWGARGFQATPFNYGAGVEYGYAMPIGKHLHLDFSIGVGYLGGPFKEYDPIDGHYVWQATKYLNWFGPTKAEVSLVWMLQFQKKGGKK
jgi:hypothetical protein